jgi:hypothetical protein
MPDRAVCALWEGGVMAIAVATKGRFAEAINMLLQAGVC